MQSANHRLLYKVAKAYYADGCTQQEIAARFGLSRPKVSRILSQAKNEQVVQIHLNPPSNGISKIEHQLEEKYGLQETVVVPTDNTTTADVVKQELGVAAADLIGRRLEKGKTLTITWGSTMMAVVNGMNFQHLTDVTVVQMLGGLGPVESLEHSSELVRKLANKLGAKMQLINSPGIVSNLETARALCSETGIYKSLETARKADIAVVGIGALTEDSYLLRDGSILSGSDVVYLKQNNAVGDIALHYFNKNGDPVYPELDKRIIGLSLDEIRKIPTIIAVSGGRNKFTVVRAALLAKIPNILVTDAITAKRLMAN